MAYEADVHEPPLGVGGTLGIISTEERKQSYRKLIESLWSQTISSCSCQTKTPAVGFHATDCEYLLIMQLIYYYEKIENIENMVIDG
jgi:hypothetical protein